MWYLLLNMCFALWIFTDARRRKMDFAELWGAASLVLMVVVVPFYISRRPLKRGEVREGGAVWCFSKWFALLWTVLMVSAAVAGKIATSHAVDKAAGNAEGTGTAILAGFGFILILGVWLVVLASVVAMGFHHRTHVTELGPTGPLKDDPRERNTPAPRKSGKADR